MPHLRTDTIGKTAGSKEARLRTSVAKDLFMTKQNHVCMSAPFKPGVFSL